jgi:hypothetical protein
LIAIGVAVSEIGLFGDSPFYIPNILLLYTIEKMPATFWTSTPPPSSAL